MFKRDKRGLIHNTLIAIGFLIAVIIIMLGYLTGRAEVDGNPIGTAQTAVLQIAHEADKATTYVDLSASLAAKEAAEEVLENGGLSKDPEGEAYVCGQFMLKPYYHNSTDACYPQPEVAFKEMFDSSLFRALSAHPDIDFPSFNTNVAVDKQNKVTRITGAASQNLVLEFGGGGKASFKFMPKAPFVPDYIAAKQPMTLNHGSRGSNAVEYIIVHYTVTHTAMDAVNVLLQRGLSYHYIIDHDGTVYQLVPESASAQHSGCPTSSYATCHPGRTGMNQPSIGISFANMGYKTVGCDDKYKNWYQDGKKCWEPYDQAQLDSFVKLVADITSRHPGLVQNGQFKESQMIMHSDVTPMKVDPGPDFTRQKAALVQRINAEMRTTTRSAPPPPPTSTPATNQGTGSAIEVVAPTPEREKRIKQYEALINKYAATNNIEAGIIKAVILQLSEAQATYTSPEGNIGLMQLLPFTKDGTPYNHNFCVDAGCGFTRYDGTNANAIKKEYEDPEKNICCGAKLLAGLAQQQPIAKICCGNNDLTKCPDNQDYKQPYHVAAQHYYVKTCEACQQCVEEDYVKSVMQLYNYFGGTPAHFTVDKDAAFQAAYSAPLSFAATADIDLSSFTETSDLAKALAGTCYDDTKNCIQQALDNHNQNPDRFYNASMACEQNPLVQTFAQLIDACMRTEQQAPCTFTLPVTAPTDNFLIRIDDKGVWKITTRALRRPVETLILAREGLGYVDFGQGRQEAQITFGFDKVGDRYDIEILFNGNPKTTADRPTPLQDRKFSFYHDGNGRLIYRHQPDLQALPPTIVSYPFCMAPTNQTTKTITQPLGFSMLIKDRVPPAVEGITWRYNTELLRYELQWKPATTYPDGKDVLDIKEYRIYCSPTPLRAGQQPPATALSLTITRKDGKFFPPQAYKAITAMAAPLERCGTRPASLVTSPTIIIIPVDGAGQYSLDYQPETMHIVSLGTIIATADVAHAELQNEQHNPLPSKPFPSQQNPLVGFINPFNNLPIIPPISP